jgi:hypothetical protein
MRVTAPRRSSVNGVIGQFGGSTSTRRRSLERLSPGGVLAAVLAVGLAGMIAMLAMHGRQWRWTGFEGNTSLWSWLQTFAQPFAIVYLTMRLISSARSWRMWRITGAVSGVLLSATIVASYSWHWRWTGFGGKQLWDWLHLMLFPVVVVLLPEWVRKGEPFGRREAGIAAVVLSGFAVLLIGGYQWAWTWTGFTGNSFHDWLDLMIAPFLLPLSCRIVHAYHASGRATVNGQGQAAATPREADPVSRVDGA